MGVQIVSDDGEVIVRYERPTTIYFLLSAVLAAKFGTSPTSNFSFSPLLDDFAVKLQAYLHKNSKGTIVGRPDAFSIKAPGTVVLSLREDAEWLVPYLNFIAGYKDVHYPWKALSAEERSKILDKLMVPHKLAEADHAAARDLIDQWTPPYRGETE